MKPKLSRRAFLTLGAAAGVLPVAAGAHARGDKTVGIALGGGGARGLAHVEILGVLDELGIRPRIIAGTSMGAVIGALYATGLSAAEIKAIVADALKHDRHYLGFFRKELMEWVHLIDPAMTSQVLLTSGDFIEFIHSRIPARSFEALKTPLLVVAADLRRREQRVLHSGDLIDALEASIAFPGLFRPISLGDDLLVDGGVVNPVPYDLLMNRCDIVIAVDVAGRRSVAEAADPSFFNVLSESFQTMEKSILHAKMADRAPDIYVKPDLVDIRLLDFAKADEIYRQAAPARDAFANALKRLL